MSLLRSSAANDLSPCPVTGSLFQACQCGFENSFLNKVHCTPYGNAGNAWLMRMVLWIEQVYFNPDFIISATVVCCGAEDVGVIDICMLKRTISSPNFESVM